MSSHHSGFLAAGDFQGAFWASGANRAEAFHAAPAGNHKGDLHDALHRAEHRSAGDGGLGHFQEQLHHQNEDVEIERDHSPDDIDRPPRPGEMLEVQRIQSERQDQQRQMPTCWAGLKVGGWKKTKPVTLVSTLVARKTPVQPLDRVLLRIWPSTTKPLTMAIRVIRTWPRVRGSMLRVVMNVSFKIGRQKSPLSCTGQKDWTSTGLKRGVLGLYLGGQQGNPTMAGHSQFK